jgi:hypothetical protein
MSEFPITNNPEHSNNRTERHNQLLQTLFQVYNIPALITYNIEPQPFSFRIEKVPSPREQLILNTLIELFPNVGYDEVTYIVNTLMNCTDLLTISDNQLKSRIESINPQTLRNIAIYKNNSKELENIVKTCIDAIIQSEGN